MDPSDTLSSLVQQDSPEPGVVVEKVFTNSPYLPWRFLWLPLPGSNHPFSGHFTQLPPALLCLCRLLLILHLGHPSVRERGDGLKINPYSGRHCGRAQKRSTICPTLATVRSPSSPPIQRDASVQTKEALGFSLALEAGTIRYSGQGLT